MGAFHQCAIYWQGQRPENSGRQRAEIWAGQRPQDGCGSRAENSGRAEPKIGRGSPGLKVSAGSRARQSNSAFRCAHAAYSAKTAYSGQPKRGNLNGAAMLFEAVTDCRMVEALS